MWVMGLWIGNARPWARGLQRFMRGPLVGEGLHDEEAVGRKVVVVLGVGGGAREDAGDVARRALRHEPQDRGGVLGAPATDGADDEVGLAGGPAEVLGGGGNAHDPAPYLSDAERSVFFSCPRKVRVGANSPKR